MRLRSRKCRRWLWADKLPLAAGGMPGGEQLDSLKRLRLLLHRMARAFVDGQAPEAADFERLNALMARGQVARRLSASAEAEGRRYQVELIPLESGWPAVEAEIAASFAAMLSEGEPSRIRFCDNPSCLWVYYDDTRNRSKRYCDDKLCGNLMKVRRFRARKKAEAAAASGSGHASDDSQS
ncbi:MULTISPECIES: CGNR zinc finger domain-containing protein [unclassified Cohnella]|uniref:CGNR zinc finger domain-containing protein n=1 Tax=unclassified Cohnella TaxID=2636738 RepID=UPI0021007147|nr:MULTISPECIES: CGNR zinc finger domain-containing protein [unclassified Cohnella]